MKKIFEKIKEKKNIICGVIFVAIIAFFSFSEAPKTLQNDTYYTVSIGNLIMENGIDMKDHFSWHEDLPYTYPHWLYDVFMSIIYNVGNWDGIYISVCVMSIILGLSIYIVNKKLNKNQVISFCITIGAMYLLKDYIAARAQLVTFILFTIQLYFMEKLVNTSKKRYGIGLIIISILIANLHVAVWPFMFILYLPYIAEYVIAIIEEKVAQKYGKAPKDGFKISIKRRDGTKYLIIVMIICAFTGFLTPLGTTPYTYLIKTMQGNTTQNINEHLPMTIANETEVLCILIIFLAPLIFFYSFIIRIIRYVPYKSIYIILVFANRIHIFILT